MSHRLWLRLLTLFALLIDLATPLGQCDVRRWQAPTRCRGTPVAVLRQKRRRSRKSSQGNISFVGRLQRARSVEAAIELLDSPIDGSQLAATLAHVATLAPRSTAERQAAASVCTHPKLQHAIRSTLAIEPSPHDVCSILWSLGMIYEGRRACTDLVLASALQLAQQLDSADVAPHVAAQALWGCHTLEVPVSTHLTTLARQLPFELHAGALRPALNAVAVESGASSAVAALAEELHFQREVIASGSKQPSKSTVVEDRGTCWLSDSGSSFSYSGKTMHARERSLTPRVAALRDAVREVIGQHYCSVLANHYPDGGSGMRFHSDPGQGEQGGWGYSTAVVSVGETRLFVFRRTDDPSVRLTYAVRHGDVLHMHSDCQAVWQHSVVRERPGGGIEGDVGKPGDSARISLVFKRRFELEKSV